MSDEDPADPGPPSAAPQPLATAPDAPAPALAQEVRQLEAGVGLRLRPGDLHPPAPQLVDAVLHTLLPPPGPKSQLSRPQQLLDIRPEGLGLHPRVVQEAVLVGDKPGPESRHHVDRLGPDPLGEEVLRARAGVQAEDRRGVGGHRRLVYHQPLLAEQVEDAAAGHEEVELAGGLADVAGRPPFRRLPRRRGKAPATSFPGRYQPAFNNCLGGSD